MKIEFTVRLPVDSHSVPFARGMCRKALEHLRVPGEQVAEIVLALTEACANVVRHAGRDSADYEVAVHIEDDVCRISVWDAGSGFAVPDLTRPVDPHDEGGTGLLLMKALVDELAFERDPDGRHRVTLEKRLGSPPALRLV